MQNIFSYANTYEDAGIDVTVSMSLTFKGGLGIKGTFKTLTLPKLAHPPPIPNSGTLEDLTTKSVTIDKKQTDLGLVPDINAIEEQLMKQQWPMPWYSPKSARIHISNIDPRF